MACIYIVEDDTDIREIETIALRNSGHTVADFDSGRAFFHKVEEKVPDLALLDIMLPDISGTEILKEIRKRSRVPVIMVTARDSVRDQLQNFENGADDYLTKPYVLSVVKAHIEAVLKRTGKLQEQIEAGGILLQPQSRKVFCGGKEIGLTPREYDVLEYLICNKKRIQKREMLLEELWGYHYVGDSRTVDTIIKQLRRKLGEYGSCIKSVYGVGYLFEDRSDQD